MPLRKPFPEGVERSAGILSKCFPRLRQRTESPGTAVGQEAVADRFGGLSGNISSRRFASGKSRQKAEGCAQEQQSHHSRQHGSGLRLAARAVARIGFQPRRVRG